MGSTPGEKRVRAFCAIPIAEPQRELITRVQSRLADNLPGVRWSNTRNLHLTLRFFGDIEAESLEKAAKLMLSVDALGSPFELPLQRLGAFPSTARARVLWLGFAPSPALQQLYRRCQGFFSEVGIPAESRPFTPHLTLGRAKGRLPNIAELLERESHEIDGNLPVERVILYRSRLLPGGAEHIPLHTIRLNGATTT